MTRWPWITVLITIAALAASACGGSDAGSDGVATATSRPADATAGGTRTNEAGNVTMKVRWDGRPSDLRFVVAMDTHSVDLDGYDLARLAVLRNGRDGDLAPAIWEAPKGGHHREGTLTFPADEPFVRGAGYIELVVRDVAGVKERVFRWDLPAQGT